MPIGGINSLHAVDIEAYKILPVFGIDRFESCTWIDTGLEAVYGLGYLRQKCVIL